LRLKRRGDGVVLNILIYENCDAEGWKIEDIIKNYLECSAFHQCSILLSTSEPDEILKYAGMYLNEKNIYFIDIDLTNNISGLELARRIRDYDIESYIILITNHSELSMQVFEYKLRALDYILKGEYAIMAARIEGCISSAYFECRSLIQKSMKRTKLLQFKCGIRYYSIPISEIVFVETCPDKHKVIVHTKTQSIDYYTSIKEIMSQLDNCIFYRCHRSYVVNIQEIVEVNRSEGYVLTSCGRRCLLSRNAFKALVEKCSGLQDG
jgi:two-component system, LytTR family, response regulator AgrA